MPNNKNIKDGSKKSFSETMSELNIFVKKNPGLKTNTQKTQLT